MRAVPQQRKGKGGGTRQEELEKETQQGRRPPRGAKNEAKNAPRSNTTIGAD